MTAEPILEVLDGGLQTTIQDLGRRGFRDQGVPLSGACDPLSLAVANRLVGNQPGAAGIECTLLGPTLLALGDVAVGLAGSDLGAVVEPGTREFLPGQYATLRPGDRLRFGGPAGPGCRAYLAVDGGLDVPVVLGSRSTCLPGRFGGLDGRQLQAGDRLSRLVHTVHPARGASPGLGPPPTGLDSSSTALLRSGLPSMTGPIRILAAPVVGASGGPSQHDALVETAWTVAAASDRRGLRLSGPAIPFEGDAASGSQPMMPGAIQVTPDGTPILLLADGGTTGGYPVIAFVISADLRLAGQARPGDTIRFVAVDLDVARSVARRAAGKLPQVGRRHAGDTPDPSGA